MSREGWLTACILHANPILANPIMLTLAVSTAVNLLENTGWDKRRCAMSLLRAGALQDDAGQRAMFIAASDFVAFGAA